MADWWTSDKAAPTAAAPQVQAGDWWQGDKSVQSAPAPQKLADTAADSAARGLPPLQIPPQRSGYAAQVAAAMAQRGANAQDQTATPQPLTGALAAGRGGDMLTGLVSHILGMGGDVQQTGIPGFVPPVPQGMPRLWNSEEVGNIINGPPADDQAALTRTLAGLLGPGAALKLAKIPGAVARGAMGLAGGNAVDPEIAALAQRAAGLKVPIRPGQASASKAVKIADDQLSTLPQILTGASDTNPLKITPAAQHEAFTRAVTRTMGEDATALTQDVMAKVSQKISDIYKTVLPRNVVALDDDLTNALVDIQIKAQDALGEAAKPVVDAVNRILDTTDKNGALPGVRYQAMRAKGGLLSALSDAKDPTISYYGGQLRGVLDDAFEAQAQGDDGALMRRARDWYRNYKILEPLAEKAPTGKISPALLLGQVTKSYPNFAKEGAGDIGDLARIGQQFLKSPPDSGTATRSAVMNALLHPFRTAATAAAAPVVGTVGRVMNSAINSQSAADRILGGVQIPIRAGANLAPRAVNNVRSGIDPKLIGMLSPQILMQLLSGNRPGP